MGSFFTSDYQETQFYTIPEELLIKIFKYLNFKDLMSIALTSKLFSRILNENYNSLVPKKHRISLNAWNQDRQWIGTRKYSNFIIDSTAIERFLDILSTNSEQIQILSLNFYNEIEVDMGLVGDILEKCVNLKELTVNFSNVKLDDRSSLECFSNMRKIEKLDYYGHSKYFKAFMNFQPKVLKLRYYDGVSNFTVYKEFLKKQKDLKELKIFGYNKLFEDPCSIFNDKALEKVDFRLEKLKITRHSQFYIDFECFEKFLLNHQKSLTHFNLSHSEINLDCLQGFIKLKNLKVERSLILTRTLNPVIENVIIKRSSIGFIDNLLNLKNLKIIESISFLKELNFTSLKKLETVQIYASQIPKLVIPSVKNLIICNAVSFDLEAFPLSGNNVENYSFKNCENIGALTDYLNQQDTKLKSLKIEDSKVEAKCLTAIKRNRHKIEVLSMKRCRKIENMPNWSLYNISYINDAFERIALY